LRSSGPPRVSEKLGHVKQVRAQLLDFVAELMNRRVDAVIRHAIDVAQRQPCVIREAARALGLGSDLEQLELVFGHSETDHAFSAPVTH
jgi:hypothetical protein